jgi:hypothetical protein
VEDLQTVADGGRLIAQSASSCADKHEQHDRTDWTGAHTVQVDDMRVGVRWNDDEIGSLLTELFAASLVTDGEAPAAYSLVRRPGDAGAADSHLLYGGSTVLVDSTSLGRAIRGLVRYLDAERVAGTPGRLRLAAAAVVGPGGATLGPGSVRGQLLQIEDQLNDRDQVLLDAPWVYVDPATAELVWEPAGLDVDQSVLDDLADGDPFASDGPDQQVRRFPIGSLFFLTGPDQDGPLGRARALLDSASLLVDPADLGASESLVALQALTGQIDVTGVTLETNEDLLKSFPAVAGP